MIFGKSSGILGLIAQAAVCFWAYLGADGFWLLFTASPQQKHHSRHGDSLGDGRSYGPLQLSPGQVCGGRQDALRPGGGRRGEDSQQQSGFLL
jgi:hypothetical protein